MDLTRLHHVAIICSDKAAAMGFYRDKLGFRLVRENYRADRDDWKIDLQFGACELELFIMKDHPQRLSPEAYGLRHLAFRIDSVVFDRVRGWMDARQRTSCEQCAL